MRGRMGTLAIALAVGSSLAAGVAPLAAGETSEPSLKLPEGVTAIASVEGIHEYKLNNGLRVLLFPDPSKQTTTVNITYLVGSRHEGYGEKGMAHLLEHLLFRGSSRHRDIPQEMTAHGARANGTTWTDRTNYYETFAATQANLEWALDLEADRMVNSFVSREDLDQEMTVVRNEFEIGENNPLDVLEERVYATAFLWHNYGLSTIGNRSDIEHVLIERLQAFYKKWYRPDNTVLVVAGNFADESAMSLINEKFGSIENPAVPVERTHTIEPPQDGERTVTLRRVGDTQAVALAYHLPAGPDPDFAALDILSFLLGDTPSGRLYKEIVEKNRATTVRSSADQFKDPGLLYLRAELRADQSIEVARDEMINVVEGFAETMPAAADVERARTALLRSWELTMRNSSMAAISLSEWSAMGDWRLMFLHRDRLRAVTPSDVMRVAATYLVPSNRTVGLFVPAAEPERATIAATQDVEAMVRDYTGGEGLAQGEVFDTTPEQIEKLVLRSTMPSGLTLILLPKKTRGETVNLSLELHFGDESSLRGQARIGELAAQMLRRGTTSRSRQEIEDEIDRLQARFSLFGSAEGVNASLETTRDHLPDALRLLADVLRNPSFPASEFEQLRQEELTRLEESRTEPRALASNFLDRHLNPYPADDVRHTPTIDEQIDRTQATSLESLERFHYSFYGASAGELAIVGDVDPAAVSGLVTEVLGNWTAAQPYERIERRVQDRPAIVEAIQTPDKESAVFRAGLRIAIRDDNPDYAALVLGNFMTGGGFLNSRLATRIRRTAGPSYGVGSWFGASAFEESGWFGAYAIYAPQNDEKLLTAFEEEIRKVLATGFSEDELAEAKTGWLQRQMVARSSDGELARKLASLAEERRDLTWDSELEERVATLGAREIQDAMRRHIDPDRISIVRAGDFARVKASAGEAAQR